MALSGNTLPQVSPGGSVSGTLHIVTSDGAGPYKAMVDTSGNGDFSNAMEMEVVTQVPGKNGNIRKTETRAWARALESMGIWKRATNINENFVSGLHHLNITETYKGIQPFKVAMPDGAICTGTVAGQSNVCMVKLVNPSNAGVCHSTSHFLRSRLTSH